MLVRTITDLGVGMRIAAAFFQSTAIRAAGFGIVPIASLAPAVKVLYVIMMVSFYASPHRERFPHRQTLFHPDTTILVEKYHDTTRAII